MAFKSFISFIALASFSRGLETAISNLKKLIKPDEDGARIIFTGDVCVVKQGSAHPYVELNGPDASLAELYNDLVEANESIEEDGDSGLGYFEDCEPNISDADFDAQALASAGHGTDEDYGCYRDDYWHL